MKKQRHKWNGKAYGNCEEGKGGLGVACLNCDCVKEIIRGKPTYFIDDTVYHKAPPCRKDRKD